MINPRAFSFIGGTGGAWRVVDSLAVAGEGLPAADHLDIAPGHAPPPPQASWVLRGVTSHERYVTRGEKERLVARQEGLGRPGATCAAMIPIRKSPRWWGMSQDERRAILEERSRHIAIGLRYLPAIARRLHHCRDLGEPEPFDFITWFEFAPRDAGAFDELLRELRATEEWRYVDREAELRLVRDQPSIQG